MKYVFALIGLLSLSSVFAQPTLPVWSIDQSKSKLTFTATQNNAPISGEFKKFEGKIKFNDTDLYNSEVKIVVDTASVFASYKDLVDALTSHDWLDPSDFPKAVFRAKGLTKTAEGYKTQGELAIRSKKQPQTVEFTLKQEKEELIAQGEFVINRLDFDLGQGEWKDTSEVKNEVKVKFDFKLKRVDTTQ